MSNVLQAVVSRAQQDPDFLERLLDDPTSAVVDMVVNDEQVKALQANVSSRLLALSEFGLAAGCGSHGTCDVTCAVTCAKTNSQRVDQVSRF